MIVGTGDLVAAACTRGGAVGAFNVVTLEHVAAVLAAAEQTGVGVVLQVSENAVRFHGGRVEPLAGAARVAAEAATVPVALHLDHVTDPELAGRASALGFGSVMIDAGALPYTENVARTRAGTDRAHADGLWVEAELGYVGGKPGEAGPVQSAHRAGVRTDPDEAVAFVAATGVDALAVAVGSSHAMTKATARLDHDLVARLRAAVPVPLVLHGSSGVAAEDLRAGVTAGISKVNVGTALGQAMTASIRATLAADPALHDPRRYLAPARDAMAAAVADVLALLP